MAVDYTTSIPELLTPEQQQEAMRQLQMDWENAQITAANRLSEYRKRTQPLPSGITYDVGNTDTPQSIDEQVLAPLRAKMAPFFPSVERQQREMDLAKRRAASEQYISDLKAQEDYKRQRQERLDWQKSDAANLKRLQEADPYYKLAKLKRPGFLTPTDRDIEWLKANPELSDLFVKKFGNLPPSLRSTAIPDEAASELPQKESTNKPRVRVRGPKGERGTIEAGDLLPVGWSLE